MAGMTDEQPGTGKLAIGWNAGGTALLPDEPGSTDACGNLIALLRWAVSNGHSRLVSSIFAFRRFMLVDKCLDFATRCYREGGGYFQVFKIQATTKPDVKPDVIGSLLAFA